MLNTRLFLGLVSKSKGKNEKDPKKSETE